MEILKAEEKDLEEILQVQYLTFNREAEAFNDFNIEPMAQTIDALKEEYKKYIFLKVVKLSLLFVVILKTVLPI